MSSCSPNLLLKLEKSQFRAHYPGFSRVLKEKIRVTAAMKLYIDDTLEDVCMIFDELEVQNSPL